MDWLIKKKIMDAEDEGWTWRMKYDALKRKADALCEAAKGIKDNIDLYDYEETYRKFIKAVADYEGKK